MRNFTTLLLLATVLFLAPGCGDSAPPASVAAAPPAAEPARPPVKPGETPEPREPEAPRKTAETPAPEQPAPESVLEAEAAPLVLRATHPFAGDLDEMREREVLRVLVSHNRTNFFLAQGKIRGFEYEMFQELDKHLAKQREPGKPPLIIAFLPVPFEELLPALLEGRGDVVAAALTVTPERSAQVAFTDPYLKDVDQILVAHQGAPAVTSWEDLAGEPVIAVEKTSYVEHLQEINEGLLKKGLEPIQILVAGRGLTTEDMLDLVSSGSFPYTVADRYLAELWSGVLDGLRLHPDIRADQGGKIAWAVRPDNPQLKAMLDGFVAENRKGTLIGNVLFKRYYGETDWLRNPLVEIEQSKIAPFLPSLKRYSEEYGFDWRLIAAQAYQESHLDPNAVSSSGAVGLMQLLPSTAKDMGFTDLTNPDDSLHDGIKYMDWLRKHFFDEPDLSPTAQIDFALAAYNAGPSRVKRWRAAAPERGLDPNRWFGNVEILALEGVGIQPVQYVGNINKYFLVFSLVLDDLLARKEELEAIDANR